MRTDVVEDLLFLLVFVESVASLVCTYDLVLLALSGAYRERLASHLVAFLIVAAALLLTAAIADYRQRLTRVKGRQGSR
jgi:hypothetical protein